MASLASMLQPSAIQNNSLQHTVTPGFFSMPVIQTHFFPGASAQGKCAGPLGQAEINPLHLTAAGQLGQMSGKSTNGTHSNLRTHNEAPTRTPSPPTSIIQDDNASANNTIFPRRKAGERTRVNSKPVVLNDTILRQLFTLPLHEAAVRLGISATAMKSACRKLGIKKWPYRSSYGVKNGAGGVRADSALTSPSTSSMSSCGMAVSRFSSSNSGNSSENGDQSSEDHDSLSRDAALLAETVMLLQQGVYRASAKHAPARGSPSPVSSRPPKKGRARKQSLACRVKTDDETTSASSSVSSSSHATAPTGSMCLSSSPADDTSSSSISTTRLTAIAPVPLAVPTSAKLPAIRDTSAGSPTSGSVASLLN